MTDLQGFMASHGERLIENGYRILPIAPGTKVPSRFTGGEWHAYPKWSSHCDRDTSPFEWDMWSRWPGCAVGLACGTVIGIDIDVFDDPKHKDYPRGEPGEDATVALGLEKLARDMLGDTPAMRIGRAPKRALYYRAATPFQGRKMHPIEVYGRGSQMVVYAVHPDTGRPYDWPEEGLYDLDISRLPEITEAQAMAWLEAAFTRIPDKWKPQTNRKEGGGDAGAWKGPSDPRGTYEAVKSALEYLPNHDVSGTEWVEMLNAIKAALGPAGRGLWLDWSKSSAKSGASGKSDTAERRWKTAQPHSVGAGSIYFMATQNGWVPPPDLILNAQAAERAADDPAADLIGGMDAAPRPAQPEPVGFPADLLSVGGIIGDLVRLFVDTAISPQPVLALGAAITLVGVLAGRKYSGPRKAMTNIYAIGIADSGGGKDHARKVIKSALYKAGLTNYLGGGKIASGSGLLTSLERHPCRLFLLDEFGKFVETVASKKAQSHQKEIWTNLTELYTSAGSVFLGSEYSDQKLRPRIDIENPCCSIYGVTVPGPLWSALGSGEISDGSLARFLLFQTDDDYPDRQSGGDSDRIPDHIIAALQSIVAGFDGGSNLPELPGPPPEPYAVPQNAEAVALLDRADRGQIDWLRSKRGTGDTAIVARFAENVGKLALIRAISDCPPRPCITGEHVEWSMKLAKHCINALLRETDRHVADNEQGANVKRVGEIIRKAGAAGLTASDLTNKTPNLDKSARTKIVADLIEGCKVRIAKEDTAGRRKTTYYWV